MSWLDSAFHRAIVEAVLVGALAGMVGVQVVLRRLAFFTMALTHATFPGVVMAAVVGANLYLGGAVAGALAAVGVALLSRRRGHDPSTSTAVVLAAGFAFGAALLSAQQGFTRDLSAYLVGSIVTVQRQDLAVAAVALGLVVLALAGTWKELLFTAFDRAGAQAAGYHTFAIDLLALLLVELVVVVAVPAVGAILAVSLIVAPASSARLWTDNVGAMTWLATAIAIGSAVGGLHASRMFDLAAGGAISLVAAAVFAVSLLVAPRWSVMSRWRRRRLVGAGSAG